MSTLLIRNVQLDGNVTNILIEGNRFANLTAPADTVADETYDASGLALVPSFFNTHTHASMTLLQRPNSLGELLQDLILQRIALAQMVGLEQL